MGAFDGLREGQVSEGYWGQHTSSIDWCETNYAVSPYIVEFVNTVTNLPVIILGIWGAVTTVTNGVNKRYAALYLGLSLIGIGSFGFHASLRWEWQMMDELPMIYVVSYSAYLTMDTLPGFEPRFGWWGPALTAAWCSFATFSYLFIGNPIYHQLAFATILISSITRNIVLIYSLPSGHPSRRLIAKTLGLGVLSFVTGFAVWNVDNIFCEHLRRGRMAIGPLGFLLEGHAIWHLLTGYGAFLIFTAAIYLELSIKRRPDLYTFSGVAWFPLVRAVMPPKPSVVGKEKEGLRVKEEIPMINL